VRGSDNHAVYLAAQERASKITSRGMARLALLQAIALVAPVGPGGGLT
jgi:hypothetical protein